MGKQSANKAATRDQGSKFWVRKQEKLLRRPKRTTSHPAHDTPWVSSETSKEETTKAVKLPERLGDPERVTTFERDGLRQRRLFRQSQRDH